MNTMHEAIVQLADWQLGLLLLVMDRHRPLLTRLGFPELIALNPAKFYEIAVGLLANLAPLSARVADSDFPLILCKLILDAFSRLEAIYGVPTAVATKQWIALFVLSEHET